MTQKTKNVALEKVLEQTILKPYDFWVGEALETRRPDCVNITSAHWHSDIFQISIAKRQITPSKLFENVQEPFCQAGIFFQKFEKWQFLLST